MGLWILSMEGADLSHSRVGEVGYVGDMDWEVGRPLSRRSNPPITRSTPASAHQWWSGLSPSPAEGRAAGLDARAAGVKAAVGIGGICG